jgi:hypothetical protein
MSRALLMLAGVVLLLCAGLAMSAGESEASARAVPEACTDAASDQAVRDQAFITLSPQLSWAPEAARRHQPLYLCSAMRLDALRASVERVAAGLEQVRTALVDD